MRRFACQPAHSRAERRGSELDAKRHVNNPRTDELNARHAESALDSLKGVPRWGLEEVNVPAPSVALAYRLCRHSFLGCMDDHQMSAEHPSEVSTCATLRLLQHGEPCSRNRVSGFETRNITEEGSGQETIWEGYFRKKIGADGQWPIAGQISPNLRLN